MTAASGTSTGDAKAMSPLRRSASFLVFMHCVTQKFDSGPDYWLLWHNRMTWKAVVEFVYFL